MQASEDILNCMMKFEKIVERGMPSLQRYFCFSSQNINIKNKSIKNKGHINRILLLINGNQNELKIAMKI